MGVGHVRLWGCAQKASGKSLKVLQPQDLEIFKFFRGILISFLKRPSNACYQHTPKLDSWLILTELENDKYFRSNWGACLASITVTSR